jgi:Tfp pilus assembly protein PilX
MVLLLLASLGLASLNVVQSDQQVAGFQNRKRVALNAAEAGISVAMETLASNGLPTVPTTPLADTTLYSHGQPSYRADPTVAPPLLKLGTGTIGGMGLGIGQNNSNQFQVQYWRINVQGNGPGGTVAHLEVVTGALQAN